MRRISSLYNNVYLNVRKLKFMRSEGPDKRPCDFFLNEEEKKVGGLIEAKMGQWAKAQCQHT
jgi:hypothetical protein